MATYTDNYNLVKPTMAETADIRTINGNMDTVDDIMHASQISLAPAYDSTETYNTGDIVMYEFLMYECLDDDVTGTWDSTKWQRTTAGEHGGGSDVEITPTLATGTKIADFEIDGVSGELYAPSGGGASYVELTQAEYNALTPAEKMNGTMYFITDASGGGGGGGGSDIHDYDNTEKVVGTYFGKTLYEKSYQNIAGTGASVNATLSDLSNIETIFIVPEASASTDAIPFPYVHYSTANIIGGFFTISNGVPTLNIRRGSDMASVGLKYLTVRYTKSST